MATPFQEIYSQFLSQLTDFQLAEMEETALEENMYQWMLKAISSFSVCRQDLSLRDNVNKTFTIELEPMEKEIIALNMAIEYLKTQTITTENLRQVLNSKDYNTYSPANQINALINLRKELVSESSTLMSRYSWKKKDFKEGWKN